MEEIPKKQFVRSQRVELDHVLPGMIVADEVKSPAGAVVIAADTILSEAHIAHLKEIGVHHLYIETVEIQKEYDALHKKTAVVVDDSLFFRHMLSKMLYRMGMFVTRETDTAEDAVRYCEKAKPDLVMVDVHLPKMSGIDMIKKLRAKLPDTKFIAVSSDQSRQNIIDCLRSGANDFIVKPVNWELLRPRILKQFDPEAAAALEHPTPN